MSRPEDRTTEQRLNRAAPFRVDEQKEALIRMRNERPDAFERNTTPRRRSESACTKRTASGTRR